jgi:hypothetical protein
MSIPLSACVLNRQLHVTAPYVGHHTAAAWDKAWATALGTTTGCSLECDAPSCGTPFKLWLYQLLGKDYDTGIGGCSPGQQAISSGS